MPGFIEGHGHFMGVGRHDAPRPHARCKNWDEVVAMVGEAAKEAKPGEWIIGRGWHQEKWDRAPQPNVEGFPMHDAISKVSPNNPVLLTHASGHASFANAKAMELAGVTGTTPNPPAARSSRMPAGTPIGIFRETASRLAARRYERVARRRARPRSARPRRSAADRARQRRSACRRASPASRTPASSFETIDLFKQVADEGQLPIRLWVMVREAPAVLAQKLASLPAWSGYGDNHLTVRAIKLSIDGALGSRGAWLLEPYSDLPTSTGLNTDAGGAVAQETARLAMQHGFQLCVHAIGDRANRETLDIFEAAFAAHPDKKDLRWRVEHAQHLNPADIPRFGKLGVIAAMQGIHCTSDAPYVRRPARARSAPRKALTCGRS